MLYNTTHWLSTCTHTCVLLMLGSGCPAARDMSDTVRCMPSRARFMLGRARCMLSRARLMPMPDRARCMPTPDRARYMQGRARCMPGRACSMHSRQRRWMPGRSRLMPERSGRTSKGTSAPFGPPLLSMLCTMWDIPAHSATLMA